MHFIGVQKDILSEREKTRKVIIKEQRRLWTYVSLHQEFAENQQVQKVNTLIEKKLRYPFLEATDAIEIYLKIDAVVNP